MKKGSCCLLQGGVLGLFWILLFALAIAPTSSEAQQAVGFGPRLSPEDAKAAWAAEARHMAKRLGVTEEATTKLVEAHQAARTSFAASIEQKREELRTEGGEDRDARRAAYRRMYQETSAAEREKLRTALAAFLSEEQVAKAVELLGSFSVQMGYMDYMVSILLGYNLGEKQDKALELVTNYILEQTALREKLSGEGADFTAVREKMAAAKSQLDESLATILSEEQLAQWKTATTFQRSPGQAPAERPREQGERE